MKKTILSFIVILFSLNIVAQTIVSQEYYEGTIDNKIKISFYISIYENECPNTYVNAMYKYNKNDSWILLNATFSEEKQQYTFVEIFNTGILLLKKEKNNFNGVWISPDGKKQLEVKLNKKQVNKKKIDALENKFTDIQYEATDC